MTTSCIWVMLLVLIIISTCFFVFRRSNIEHFFTFDEVLDQKCREITAGDVKNDYKWGTGQCQKTQEQCNGLPVTCFNTGSQSVKVQDGSGGCRDPDNCITTNCSVSHCYKIECNDSNLCDETMEDNIPDIAGNCKAVCSNQHETCDGNQSDRWKIVGGKWKKYETKMNYNLSGNCVRKYLDGSRWEEIQPNDDSFKNQISECSIGNITLGDDTTQFRTENNGDIVCSNNPSLKWSVVTRYNNADTHEFNNRLELEGGAFIDLYHNSEDTCTLSNVVDETYASYCTPPDPSQFDSYTEDTYCFTENGRQLFKKNGETNGTRYIHEDDLTYSLHTPSTCYNECLTIGGDKKYLVSSCVDLNTQCSRECGDQYSTVVNEHECVCSDYERVTNLSSSSNCYFSDSYSKYDLYYGCKNQNGIYTINDNDTCNFDGDQPLQLTCFDPLGVGTTPGFTQLEGDCYELSGGPQGIYFKFATGTEQVCTEGGCSYPLTYTMIRDDSCEPQIPDTPTITISEVENTKTDNSITVYVTTPDIRDPYPYTRLMYTNDPSEESFEALASLRLTTPTTNLVYGNNNEGYINVVGRNTTKFENLLPNTPYTFKIVTVHDEVVNNNVYSDPLVVSTAPQQTITPPQTPYLEITNQTHNSITVDISNLDYGDYTDETTRTRILYKKIGNNTNWDTLATETSETSYPLINGRNGDRNRGYIELINSILDKTITIPNLDSDTKYKIKVVIVYGLTPSKISSDEIQETTTIEPGSRGTWQKCIADADCNTDPNVKLTFKRFDDHIERNNPGNPDNKCRTTFDKEGPFCMTKSEANWKCANLETDRMVDGVDLNKKYYYSSLENNCLECNMGVNERGRNPTKIRFNGMCFEKMNLSELMDKLSNYGNIGRGTEMKLRVFSKNNVSMLGWLDIVTHTSFQSIITTYKPIINSDTANNKFYFDNSGSNNFLRTRGNFKACLEYSGINNVLFIPVAINVSSLSFLKFAYNTEVYTAIIKNEEDAEELFFILEWKTDSGLQNYMRLVNGEIGITDYVGTDPAINGHDLLYFQALRY